MRYLATISCLPLLACTQSSFVRTSQAPRPTLARAPTPVMYTLGAPDRPYTDVGRVSAKAFGVFASAEDTSFAALQRVARTNGCDGVIVLGPRDKIVFATADHATSAGASSAVEIVRGPQLAWYAGRWVGFRGACIVYL